MRVTGCHVDLALTRVEHQLRMGHEGLMPRGRINIDKVWDAAAEGWTDIACGEGYNTRILARKGAKVTGIDNSRKLIGLAEAEERREPLGIRYHRMDANRLKDISDRSFDLITCFMALHDIEDYARAVAEVARVLKDGGRFVFSIPHPCFEKLTVNGVRIDAAEIYFKRIKYPIEWNMKRLTKQFKTISFHRTLTDYSRVLAKNGFLISRLVEPRPTLEAVRRHPNLRDELAKPQSIIFESTKTVLVHES